MEFEERVRLRAFFLYESEKTRDRERALDDWLEAERRERALASTATTRRSLSMTSLSFYREDFLAEQARVRAEREPLRDRICNDRKETSKLLVELVPQAEDFFDALEAQDDIPAAIASGALTLLEREGYVRNNSQFASGDALQRNARVWSLRITTEGVVGVDRSGAMPQGATQWDEVVLQAKVDKKNRRIDTEFFGLNEALEESEPTFDDREKLHIVWQLEKDESLSLYYLGFGANEPYDLELEENAIGFSGRPRFFIYDVERKLSLRYAVDWIDEGVFDWDWSARAIRILDDRRRELSFVQFHDGCRVCISDREVANAAAGYTLDEAVGVSATMRTPLSKDELREKTRRMRAVLKGPILEPLPRQPPNPAELVGRPGADYVAYFVAAASEKPRTARSLVKAIDRLEPARREEYRAILERSPTEVFREQIAAALPKTMRELFDLDPRGSDGTTQAAVAEWTEKLATEIRRDLYYYGQAPLPRINRLRLGAELAFSERHGGIYWKVRDQAKRLLLGEAPFGEFKVNLDPA